MHDLIEKQLVGMMVDLMVDQLVDDF